MSLTNIVLSKCVDYGRCQIQYNAVIPQKVFNCLLRLFADAIYDSEFDKITKNFDCQCEKDMKILKKYWQRTFIKIGDKPDEFDLKECPPGFISTWKFEMLITLTTNQAKNTGTKRVQEIRMYFGK